MATTDELFAHVFVVCQALSSGSMSVTARREGS